MNTSVSWEWPHKYFSLLPCTLQSCIIYTLVGSALGIWLIALSVAAVLFGAIRLFIEIVWILGLAMPRYNPSPEEERIMSRYLK